MCVCVCVCVHVCVCVCVVCVNGSYQCSLSPDFVIKRAEKYGGDVSFASYEELEQAYIKEVRLGSSGTSHMRPCCCRVI